MLAALALDVSRELGVDAGEIRAAVAQAGEGEPRSRAEQIVALSAAYEALVADRPYRARISETEALEEALACPALTGGDELGRAFERGLSCRSQREAGPGSPGRDSAPVRPATGATASDSARAPRPSGALKR